MRILGVIPARGGSKGIRKKNLKLLCGQPLIYYTIKASSNSNLDRVIVSTDSEELIKISNSLGAEVLKRPSELAKDDSTTLAVLEHVLQSINESYDAIMVLQPTSPLRRKEHINESIEIFKNDNEADSLVSVVKVPHNFYPYKQMSLDNGYLFGGKNIFRRQDLHENLYARNGAAIYISRINILNKSILGDKTLPYFMNKIDSIDIDDMEDWFLVESILKSNLLID